MAGIDGTKVAIPARGPAVGLSGAAEGSSDGTSGKGTSKNGPPFGTSTEYLTPLERMTALKYKGDMFLMKGQLHAAALAYSRGLEVKCPGKEPPETRRMHDGIGPTGVGLLTTRVYVYFCLSERAAAGGEEALSRQFLRRVLRDCREVQRAPTETDKTGFLLAAHALLKLGHPEQVSMAMLHSADIPSKPSDSGDLRDMLAETFSHPTSSSLLEEVLESQDRWQQGAEKDTAWLEGLKKDKHVMGLLRQKSKEEDSSLFYKGLDTMKQVHEPAPFSGSVLMHEKHPSLVELDSDPAGQTQASALTECVLEVFPGGLYDEKSCGMLSWKEGLPLKEGQGPSACCSGGSLTWRLEVAKRCLHIGNAEAEAGRLIQAVRWYTRGITTLLPGNWEHFKENRYPAGALAVALALLFNRSQIYLQLAALPHLGLNRDTQFNLNAGWDALWCAYYGRGWTWGIIALSQAMLKVMPMGRMDWLLLEEEVKKRGEDRSPTELVEARDAVRDTVTEAEKAAIPWDRAPHMFKVFADKPSGMFDGSDGCDVSMGAMACMGALALKSVLLVDAGVLASFR